MDVGAARTSPGLFGGASRGLAVGLAAGATGGLVNVAVRRGLEGRWSPGAAAVWIAGGALAGMLLGSAPRRHEHQSLPSSMINTAFVVGSVVGAASAAPSLVRAGRAIWNGGVRGIGAELGHAGTFGLAGFAAAAAATMVAVPLGLPQHFDIVRR